MKIVNRILLSLEIGVVIGLGLLFVLASQTWTIIQQPGSDVPGTLPPGGPTATALIRLAQLPASSHVHIQEDSSLLPISVIPANIRLSTTAQPLPRVTLPTPGPQHAVRILIPAIGVDAPVVHGVDAASLRLGVGHYEGSTNPGERGNLVLAGHNDAYGQEFRDLDHLQAGDEVTVYTASLGYTYVIRGTRLVEPTDVSVLEPTVGPTLTLISCYPYLVDTERIIVFGELDER